jgi:hypothetical protein
MLIIGLGKSQERRIGVPATICDNLFWPRSTFTVPFRSIWKGVSKEEEKDRISSQRSSISKMFSSLITRGNGTLSEKSRSRRDAYLASGFTIHQAVTSNEDQGHYLILIENDGIGPFDKPFQ